MRIVLDAMGADDAPSPEIAGAVEAARDGQCDIVLVGDETVLKRGLARFPTQPNISVVHASEAIGMHEKPVMAVRKKKDASMLVGLRLVKNGEGDAFVSAGNTGAVMVAARTILMPIKGVQRSAVCQTLPTFKEPVVVLDLGANVDCTARHLCQFAEMGTVFARHLLGKENPRVGLLNIGEEDIKGTEISRAVNRSLEAEPHVNFIGNVEPKAIFKGDTDVVVCDGFAGNLVLKTSEASASLMGAMLRRELESNWLTKLGALLSKNAFKNLKKKVDPNEYHGATLLGVNGVCIILHGSSTAQGVANGIRGAVHAVKHDINSHIREAMEDLRAAEERLAEGLTQA